MIFRPFAAFRTPVRIVCYALHRRRLTTWLRPQAVRIRSPALNGGEHVPEVEAGAGVSRSPPGVLRLKLGLMVLLALVAVGVGVALIEVLNLGGQIGLRMSGRLEDEIGWMEGLEPVRVWDPGRHGRIERRYAEWMVRELRAGRVDRAVHVMRRVRAGARAHGTTLDPVLVKLGLETYTRAADRLQRHGRLSLAADWNDTLFVFAVRDPDPRNRAAASAAFVEGLGLRVRDGRPCEALSRTAWARRGLGGEIPNLDPAIEASLAARCDAQRRAADGALRPAARNGGGSK